MDQYDFSYRIKYNFISIIFMYISYLILSIVLFYFIYGFNIDMFIKNILIVFLGPLILDLFSFIIIFIIRFIYKIKGKY